MANSANTFNYVISDDDVRITFLDIRPDARPDEFGGVRDRVVAEIVGEIVVSRVMFKQMLDIGSRVLDDHEAKKTAN